MHVKLRLGSEFRLWPARTPCSLKAELQTWDRIFMHLDTPTAHVRLRLGSEFRL